jgi:tetratricopeptide (TPR) repeat protein
LGVLCFSAALYAQLPEAEPSHVEPSSVFPDWPGIPTAEPISGVVSLRELEHPISKKAGRAAYEAQQLSRANKIPQAIAKLEKAIRIDPSYRDAHWNLGVQYTRVGRIADARAEFQKALDIGPPAAPLLVDLAFASAAAGEVPEALAFARKALALDPENVAAQLLLNHAPH